MWNVHNVVNFGGYSAILFISLVCNKICDIGVDLGIYCALHKVHGDTLQEARKGFMQ